MSEGAALDADRVQRMARRMKRVNVPMRFVLGLPFPTPLASRLMLVYFTAQDRSAVPAAGQLRP